MGVIHLARTHERARESNKSVRWRTGGRRVDTSKYAHKIKKTPFPCILQCFPMQDFKRSSGRL